jgi:hypothetical protein
METTIAVLFAAISVWTSAPTVDAVTASIARAPRATLHEPVIITVTIENRLQESVTIDLGADRKANYRFVLTGSTGTQTAGRPFFKGVDAVSASGRVTIHGGQRYVQDLLLNEWFDFEAPGLYTLQMRVNAPLRTESGVTLEPFAVTTPVEILSRDEPALRATLDRLVNAASSPGPHTDWMEAASALMSVSDPIAIPYIREVLKSTTMADAIIIPKLAYVPGDAVKAMLNECAQSGFVDRSLMARDALRRRELPANAR